MKMPDNSLSKATSPCSGVHITQLPTTPSATTPVTQKNEGVFTCIVRCADGEVCGAIFNSKHGLHAYQSFIAGGEHKKRELAVSLTVTNMCMWCSTTFSKVETARIYACMSLKKSFCMVDSIVHSYEVHELSGLPSFMLCKGLLPL